ncbi:MAG: hypothetical protein HYW49_05285 [Deltaproteobacteria bacterium]|nr:hypothetical protein [Deltaproteobacteria bacterium]
MLTRDELRDLAAKYIWWKDAEEAVSDPDRVIAQVMNIGDYDDVRMLSEKAGDDRLREVLASAQPGQFNERSWAYWHYRLGLARAGKVPKIPVRKFA